MKFKNLFRTFLVTHLVLASFPLALAGGSSVRVNETNVRDKILKAGMNDQLLMSFKVEPGNISINNFDLHCVPADGLKNLTLMQGGKMIDSTTFSSSSGMQKAHFGANDFILPVGQETEFELLVDVDAGVKSYITTCAIDDLTFKDNASGKLYDSGFQSITFKGINKLIYVENPNLDVRDDDFYVIKKWALSKNLALDSKNNALASFTINSSKQTKLKDLFMYCSRGSILKNFTLNIDGTVVEATDVQTDWYTNSRPEHSFDKRIVFSNLGKVFGPSAEAAEMTLYADTHNYFSYPEGTWPQCEIIDVMAINNEAFEDVNKDNNYYEAVQYLYERKMIQGYPDQTFRPEQKINRAEFLKILPYSKEVPLDTPMYQNCFSDVQNQWFAPAICYAKKQGWVKGYSSDIFKPEREINNVEALKMLFESQSMHLQPTGNENWYAQYVKQAEIIGIISHDNFIPGELMTRGEVAKYLQKVYLGFI
jgi:hypothetical protein